MGLCLRLFPGAVAAILAAVLLSGVGRSAQQPLGYPRSVLEFVDEAVNDAALREFRDSLIRAVEQRDVDHILDVTDGSQRAAAEASLTSGDWFLPILGRVLSLGGAFTVTRGTMSGRREFCAPYYYVRYPRPVPDEVAGGHDYEPWVVVGSDVAVRREPVVDSEVRTRIKGHELVRITGREGPTGPPPFTWREVVAPDGRTGWVQSADLGDPDGWRICMALVDGEWVISRLDRGVIPW